MEPDICVVVHAAGKGATIDPNAPAVVEAVVSVLHDDRDADVDMSPAEFLADIEVAVRPEP
jgi:hypothetical protein